MGNYLISLKRQSSIDIENGYLSASVKTRNSSKGILNIYFNCCFYMLLLPFKPSYDKLSGSCKLKSSRFQKFLCYFFMWFLVIVHTISTHIHKVYKLHLINAISTKEYCDFFASFLYSFKQLKFLWTVYYKQEKIEEYLTSVSNNRLLIKEDKNGSLRRLFGCFNTGCEALFMVFIFIVYVTNFMMLGNHVLFHLPQFVASSRFKMFIRNDSKNVSELFYSPENISVGSVEFLLRCISMLDLFHTVIFFLFPFPLWKSIRRLERLAKTSPITSQSVQELNEMYEDVKHLSHAGNEAWASLNLLWISDLSVRIVLRFDEVVHSRNVFQMVVVFGSQGLLITSLIVGAEVARIGSRFREWIVMNRRRISEQTFPLNKKKGVNTTEAIVEQIIEELHARPLGIGSTGVYILDYSFLAQLLTSIIVTLFLSFPPP
ncbi:unnamed protein product [Orchesella dallaii]|uniref:Gustatory receptor n=1 Tax=Orchesella dallaii TaxID=48710 RepID=A0ABP1Q1S8_9HEXA